MRRVVSSLFLVLVIFAFQAYAKAPAIPAMVLQARYVALGYETANGFVSETEFVPFPQPGVEPSDRQVLSNIYDALSKWKRYVITIVPQQAELLIAVRTGRRAAATGGVRVQSGGIDPTAGGRRGIAIGPVIGAEAGPAEDYLAVYQADEGREAARLWVRTQENGLLGKNPPLFQSFRDAVESAAKQTKSKTP